MAEEAIFNHVVVCKHLRTKTFFTTVTQVHEVTGGWLRQTVKQRICAPATRRSFSRRKAVKELIEREHIEPYGVTINLGDWFAAWDCVTLDKFVHRTAAKRLEDLTLRQMEAEGWRTLDSRHKR